MGDPTLLGPFWGALDFWQISFGAQYFKPQANKAGEGQQGRNVSPGLTLTSLAPNQAASKTQPKSKGPQRALDYRHDLRALEGSKPWIPP